MGRKEIYLNRLSIAQTELESAIAEEKVLKADYKALVTKTKKDYNLWMSRNKDKREQAEKKISVIKKQMAPVKTSAEIVDAEIEKELKN